MKLLPEFLSLQDILELHSMQIVQYGGTNGIRSIPLLESAVAMPMATFDSIF